MSQQDVKLVQLTVWLGAQQRVEILADKRINRHPCHDPSELARADLANAEVVDLLCQLGRKLCSALKAKAPTIRVTVNGPRIEADP